MSTEHGLLRPPRTEGHWDPEPHEREYFRSSTTGDLGWLVRRDGKDKVRLDRPAQEVLLQFNNGTGWIPELEQRPYTPMQAAQISFAADRVLCRILGKYNEARVEWMGLKDEERIRWVERGPKGPDIRKECYKALHNALRPYVK